MFVVGSDGKATLLLYHGAEEKCAEWARTGWRPPPDRMKEMIVTLGFVRLDFDGKPDDVLTIYDELGVDLLAQQEKRVKDFLEETQDRRSRWPDPASRGLSPNGLRAGYQGI